jgi:hypothetical protein
LQGHDQEQGQNQHAQCLFQELRGGRIEVQAREQTPAKARHPAADEMADGEDEEGDDQLGAELDGQGEGGRLGLVEERERFGHGVLPWLLASRRL